MKKIEIKECGLVGNLYLPATQIDKLPCIILMSGSDGGMPGANAIPEYFIESLVSNNFAVLALAYFGLPGLPSNLENINLEYFENAISWCQSQPQIKADLITLIGQSRGGELALILGTIFPEQIKAIVSYVPCNMRVGGATHPNQPAWIYKGMPLAPYLHGVSSNDMTLSECDDLINTTKDTKIAPHENTAEDPFIVADLFKLRNMQTDHQLTEISVEKILCPLLLFSGGEDALWPSEYYCDKITERLDYYNSDIMRKHINYKNAGHGIFASRDGGIYHSFGKFWCKLGGDSKSNEDAKKESMIELLKFLKLTLGNCY